MAERIRVRFSEVIPGVFFLRKDSLEVSMEEFMKNIRFLKHTLEKHSNNFNRNLSVAGGVPLEIREFFN